MNEPTQSPNTATEEDVVVTNRARNTSSRNGGNNEDGIGLNSVAKPAIKDKELVDTNASRRFAVDVTCKTIKHVINDACQLEDDSSTFVPDGCDHIDTQQYKCLVTTRVIVKRIVPKQYTGFAAPNGNFQTVSSGDAMIEQGKYWKDINYMVSRSKKKWHTLKDTSSKSSNDTTSRTNSSADGNDDETTRGFAFRKKMKTIYDDDNDNNNDNVNNNHNDNNDNNDGNKNGKEEGRAADSISAESNWDNEFYLVADLGSTYRI